MRNYQVSFSEVVALLVNHRQQLHEDGVRTPFEDARDKALSEAAGAYLRNYIQRQQRYRTESIREPFKEMLRLVGFAVLDMSTAEYDDLTEDMDDLYLRMQNFADALLKPIEKLLEWHVVVIDIDWGGEILNIALGEDYRIRKYYELRSTRGVVVPNNPTEISDLDPVLDAFDDYVKAIFDQIEVPAIHDELKATFIERLSKITR